MAWLPGGPSADALSFFSLSRLRERVASVASRERAPFVASALSRPRSAIASTRAPSPASGRGESAFAARASRKPRSAARLYRRAGRASSQKKGMERRSAHLIVLPPCEGDRHPCDRMPTPCGAPLRLLSIPGHAFGGARARRHQPAPGGRAVVPSRWSPGPPGTGMPAGRGDRVSKCSSHLPRKYQRRISASFLRPAPRSRRLMSAPLTEQVGGEDKGGLASGDYFFS
jgi:hypothetical protein